MEQIIGKDWVDWFLNIAILLCAGNYFWTFFNNKAIIGKRFDINDGNQNQLIHYVTVQYEQIEHIRQAYIWEIYSVYDNRLTEYRQLFFDNLTKEHRGEEHSQKFWNELTRGQKIFWSFLAIEGEIDNGGLFQFINNYPEHLYSARQVMVELGQDKIIADYDEFLEEVEQKKMKLSWNIWQSNSPISNQRHRIKAFSDGYKILESTDTIEDYFDEEDFKRQWHKAMCDYIEQNIEQFSKVI
ncbi:DMP19 family protein [Arcicella rigui]|uniref:DUF4375 domain-containing protein n=1 Tax=Arcicella rigui TaxID=797020 RepID=A0ABU5Q9D7_9BACT|nr:DUF4375 domain-containing protein [Arcicella rigui]MEA5139429.1 DUF4375 domain-containing protein [Arcicella rigui]